jgi:hypothetical protein
MKIEFTDANKLTFANDWFADIASIRFKNDSGKDQTIRNTTFKEQEILEYFHGRQGRKNNIPSVFY